MQLLTRSDLALGKKYCVGSINIVMQGNEKNVIRIINKNETYQLFSSSNNIIK